MHHRICIHKVNIMHFFLSLFSPLFLSFSLFLRSRHFRARQRKDLSRGEARQNLTPSPLPSSLYHHHHRRLAELSECYKRVRERAIRQRCNTVLRTPLSSRRISYFVDFVSSIRARKAKRKFKGNLSFNIFFLLFPVINEVSFPFSVSYFLSQFRNFAKFF